MRLKITKRLKHRLLVIREYCILKLSEVLKHNALKSERANIRITRAFIDFVTKQSIKHMTIHLNVLLVNTMEISLLHYGITYRSDSWMCHGH